MQQAHALQFRSPVRFSGHRGRAWPGVWLGLIGLFGGGGLHAQESSGKPVVTGLVVAADKFSEQSAAVLNHVVRENLERTGIFAIKDTRAWLAEDTEDPRRGHYQKALEGLRRGRELYDNMEIDEAIEELGRALGRFEKGAAYMGSGAEYLKARLYLGATLILSGDNPAGLEEFRKVALYDRRTTLDPKEFPPSMIEFFNRTRQGLSNLPTSSVQIQSNPVGAEVYLNGVFMGGTPLTLTRVPVGSHFVRLEKDGYLPWAQRVKFEATSETSTTGNLTPTQRLKEFAKLTRLRANDLEEDPPVEMVLQLGRKLGVDLLVVAVARKRGEEVSIGGALVRIRPGKTVRTRSLEIGVSEADHLAKADAFFSSLVQGIDKESAAVIPVPADTAIAASSARRPDCQEDADCPPGKICDVGAGQCLEQDTSSSAFYKTWWFWALVGGGLVVAGGTTALVLTMGSSSGGTLEFSF